MRSNCVLYALGQFLRRGGTVLCHRSKFGPWLHVWWSPDLPPTLTDLREFAPVERKRRRWFPPLWFRGRVRRWTP